MFGELSSNSVVRASDYLMFIVSCVSMSNGYLFLILSFVFLIGFANILNFWIPFLAVLYKFIEHCSIVVRGDVWKMKELNSCPLVVYVFSMCLFTFIDEICCERVFEVCDLVFRKWKLKNAERSRASSERAPVCDDVGWDDGDDSFVIENCVLEPCVHELFLCTFVSYYLFCRWSRQ